MVRYSKLIFRISRVLLWKTECLLKKYAGLPNHSSSNENIFLPLTTKFKCFLCSLFTNRIRFIKSNTSLLAYGLAHLPSLEATLPCVGHVVLTFHTLNVKCETLSLVNCQPKIIVQDNLFPILKGNKTPEFHAVRIQQQKRKRKSV